MFLFTQQMLVFIDAKKSTHVLVTKLQLETSRLQDTCPVEDSLSYFFILATVTRGPLKRFKNCPKVCLILIIQVIIQIIF